MDYQTYEIGGKAFYQSHLGNLQQTLIEELLFSTFSDGTLQVTDALSLYQVLGNKRPTLMALALIDQGMPRKEFVAKLQEPGFLEERQEFFADESTPGTKQRVIADFFICNQIGLYIESLTNLMAWTQAKADLANPLSQQNGSNGSAPSSLEATLPTETPSTP